MIHAIAISLFIVILLTIVEAQRRRLAVQYEIMMHLESELKDLRWKENRERIEKVQKARERERLQAEMDAKMDANPS